VNKLLLFAITRMRETFYQVFHLVSVMQNTWRYNFTAMYRTLRPFWTADIGPSYQVCQLLSTKLELHVSEGFPLVLQFKNRYLKPILRSDGCPKILYQWKGSAGIRTVRNFGVDLNAAKTKFMFMSHLWNAGRIKSIEGAGI